VVVNDVVHACVARLQAIVAAERATPSMMSSDISAILASFGAGSGRR
jgi:hypothetical protein